MLYAAIVSLAGVEPDMSKTWVRFNPENQLSWYLKYSYLLCELVNAQNCTFGN